MPTPLQSHHLFTVKRGPRGTDDFFQRDSKRTSRFGQFDLEFPFSRLIVIFNVEDTVVGCQFCFAIFYGRLELIDVLTFGKKLEFNGSATGAHRFGNEFHRFGSNHRADFLPPLSQDLLTW